MIDTRHGWADRTTYGIWLVAFIWFVDGVAMTLIGLYLARQIQ